MPGIAKDACGRQAYSLRFIILLFTEAVSFFEQYSNLIILS